MHRFLFVVTSASNRFGGRAAPPGGASSIAFDFAPARNEVKERRSLRALEAIAIPITLCDIAFHRCIESTYRRISDRSLNVFLAMSLMSMQLWMLGGLGPSLVAVLAAPTLVAVVYMVFVVFPAMGANYEAVVITAGYAGISLGATPTAIANMTAITKTHGAAPTAFIILPLVSAFFIDLANAAAIRLLVR
ncbi:MAG: sodium/glutamate symporter [Methylocystis sp.]